MGVWQRVGSFLGVPTHRFNSESAPRPIDQVIWEMAGRGTASVSREQALTVPAMQRGRNLICSISTLPLVQRRADNSVMRSPLLEQIDPDVANVVTLAMTLEDLLFEGIAWWEVLATDGQGYPVSARHLDTDSVTIDPPIDGRSLNPLPAGYARNGPTVWIDGTEVPANQVIRFDSPNPAVLVAGAVALRRAIRLDRAAAMYADDPRPLDYFTPAEGAEEIDDKEVLKILGQWRAARKKRSTAWVPKSMKYNAVDAPSPQQLQLVELQGRAALDVANMVGVDPEELGVSTTSRTYANVIDRRQDKINDVLSSFMLAISQRLSMGDVTRRGHRVEHVLSNYLKANPTDRWAIYKARKELGVIDAAGILREEGEPPLPPDFEKPAPPVAPVPPPATDPEGEPTVDDATMAASRARMFAQMRAEGLRLNAGDDGKPTFTFAGGDFAGGSEPATVDVESRTITGLALPYNKIARKYGFAYRFKPGSLDYDTTNLSRIKHLMDHSTPVGIHTSVRETARGPMVKLKVLSGPEGSPARLERDQLLYDAEHGLYDGLSVGVDFSMDPAAGDVEWNERDQVYDVLRASWRETSSTPMPAFDDARVTKVAASRNNQGVSMKCATCGQEHAPGVACPTGPPTNQPDPAPAGVTLNNDQLAMLLSHPGAIQALVGAQQAAAAPATPTPAGGLTLSAEQVQSLIKNGGLGTLLGVPHLTPAPAQAEADKPAAVNPTRRPVAVTASKEPLPYRFDRQGNLTRGVQYDFSTDLVSGAAGDGEAMNRAQAFLKAHEHVFTNTEAARQFAVGTDTTDIAALNPNRNRPDLYVDQQEFTYPIWDAISKGTLADQVPFVLPKFGASSGMVAAHVEGVEPTTGTITATAQTITPSAVSGKVDITREAWDAGGNPQLSGIIWRQMIRAWFESLEASAVAMLDALTPVGITLTPIATNGQTQVGELSAAIAALQFVRGGMRMRDLFLQIDLYKMLTGAKDNDGRALLPLLGAVNANGTVSDLFADINVAGLRGRPAWALAATGAVPASSYLFDRNDVHGWASAPQRLQFEYRVSHVDVGIWGYKATANTDLTGVREIIYDPA